MKKLPLFFASAALTLLVGCPLSPASQPLSAPEVREPTTITIDITAQWQAAPDRAFGEIAAASAGDEGAIAYAEVEDSPDGTLIQSRIMLQRLDNLGATRGVAITLGVVPLDHLTRVTLASDGVRYIACWAGYDDKIACATAPVAEGNASPALSINGRWPSVAHSSAGWALAYGVSGQLAVLHLADDGTAVGDPVAFDVKENTDSKTLLSASKTGFVLLGESGGSVHVYWLDGGFSCIGSPIDLGKPFWFQAAMAVSGTNVAVAVGKPYGGYLFVVNGTAIQDRYEFGSGGKTGANAVVGVDGSSFGVLSADDNEGLHYGFIDDGASTTLSEGARPSEGVLSTTNQRYLDGSLAIVKFKEETFLAATPGAYSNAGKVVIARVRRMPVE